MSEYSSISSSMCSKRCSKGEKVTAKAHGGRIEIQGITVAKVDEKLRLQSVETWFDPMEMFRQIAANGAVTKTSLVQVPGKDLSAQLFGEENEVHGGEDSNLSTVDASAACPFLPKD
jgi:hypothetical protein